LAPSDTDPDQIKTERFVVEHHIGSVVSMSFGEAEVCMASHLQREQHAVLRAATSHGITLLAASGDLGASNGAPPWPCSGASLIKAVSTPGSDPNVTGVGGTDLVANLKTGRYRRESVWNEGIDGGAGGGGFSSLYSRPSYQARAVRRSRRGLPDVVYSASS